MGKRFSVFLASCFLLACSLWAAPVNYMKQLETYDTQMQGASNDELLRIFHGLKGVYIQSIISGNDTLKKETLERLVKSAKTLKLDASKYESELSTMHKGSSHEEKQPAPALEQPVYSKEKDLPREKAKTTLPSSYKGKNVLHSVLVDEKNITLEFGSTMSEKGIKVFGLNSSESYKKVIDIPAILLNNPPAITPPKKLHYLRISQYNNDTLRVVMDASKAFDVYISVMDTKVVLSFEKTAQSVEAKPAVKPDSLPVKNTPTILPMPQPSKNALPPSKSMRNKTIVIDAGHGGKDVGAIGYKQRMEKYLVLDIALELGKVLKQRGYKVFYTRDKDVFINLRDRTKVANDKNADLFISLHANAAPNEAKKLSMKGVETFFLSPDRSERSKNVAALENQSDMEEMDFYSKEAFLNVFNREKIVLSNKAAIDIQSHMLHSAKKKYAVDDGGVREAPFWVLVGATMPSVLIELGYISNPEESDRMFNPQYQKLLVEGMSNGIDSYFINNP